jgi:hypothetical protein
VVVEAAVAAAPFMIVLGIYMGILLNDSEGEFRVAIILLGREIRFERFRPIPITSVLSVVDQSGTEPTTRQCSVLSVLDHSEEQS